jgi:hypothetical protein
MIPQTIRQIFKETSRLKEKGWTYSLQVIHPLFLRAGSFILRVSLVLTGTVNHSLTLVSFVVAGTPSLFICSIFPVLLTFIFQITSAEIIPVRPKGGGGGHLFQFLGTLLRFDNFKDTFCEEKFVGLLVNFFDK